MKIRYLYEECRFEPFPGWVVAKEDRRIYHGSQFGLPGDAWATVVTAQIGEEAPIAGFLSRYIPYFHSHELAPLSTWLQLRVCSPTFRETDARFLVAGKHLALVQQEFDMEEVRRYIDKRLQETADLKLSDRYHAWEKHFHLFDPDDD